MTWKEYRIAHGGRKGWDLSLPRFEDGEHPEDAKRMNRFYDTAAEGMEQAAGLAMTTEARRVRYRCETDVAVIPALTEDAAETNTPDTPPVQRKRKGIRFPFERKKKQSSPDGEPGDIRVSLRLTLSVSGQWTREKTLVHLWRDGTLQSSQVLL